MCQKENFRSVRRHCENREFSWGWDYPIQIGDDQNYLEPWKCRYCLNFFPHTVTFKIVQRFKFHGEHGVSVALERGQNAQTLKFFSSESAYQMLELFLW